jgi:hypothetical protein
VLRAVVDEARSRDVPVRRVSQGSGVMMLTDAEIAEMAEIGAETGIEVSLFFGPRGEWDTGGQSFRTGAVDGCVRGADGLAWCAAEAMRACRLGIRSLLIADVGALALVASMRRAGDLPPNLCLKTSVMLPCTNPATARTFEQLGANTLNVATDLSPAELGEMRRACSIPIDVYVEAPPDQGGFVRFYEVADIVRAAAPVYVKFGLRNATPIYPVGKHLAAVAIEMGREKVRRAELCLRLLGELAPELGPPSGVDRDLALPEPLTVVPAQ